MSVYCHSAYLTYMQSTSWEMLDWMKHKLESRLLGELSMTSDMQMTGHFRMDWLELLAVQGTLKSFLQHHRSAVILEPPKIKCHFPLFPHLFAMKWWDQTMILVFWMLSFKPTFSLSSFTFIKRLCSSSSLSAIRVVSSAYLRSLIFLPGILIPTPFLTT